MHTNSSIEQLLDASSVHPEWRVLLTQALHSVDGAYLASLLGDESWLPGRERLFAAFKRDLQHCRYILFGESPYPRKSSANGIAFYDAAVHELWSDKGLSKGVNRATSLRNIVKTALLAEGIVRPGADGKITQAAIAGINKDHLVQSIDEVFGNLHQRGLLMFNATPVLHPHRKPTREARYWERFVFSLLEQVLRATTTPPTLLLWGKIAQKLQQDPVCQSFPLVISEHPYNLSFIDNPDMRKLFSQLKILQRDKSSKAIPGVQ